MNSIKYLQNAIFWQKHVIAESRDAAQIARCTAALARLEAQLTAELSMVAA